jgi:uncharacterized protein (TIGR03790 family)
MKPVLLPVGAGHRCNARKRDGVGRSPRFATVALAVLGLFCALPAHRAAAIEPGQIALIVNSKVPAGTKLAEFYAQQRHIPSGRIIAIDLPDSDDIPYDTYNSRIVSEIRSALKDRNLEDQVKCLVTFYGVPLRIGGRTATEAEKLELEQLNAEYNQIVPRARDTTKSLEDLALQLDPAFKPASSGNEVQVLPARADAAVQSCLRSMAAAPDSARRQNDFANLLVPIEVLYGPLELTKRLTKLEYATLAAKPPTTRQVGETQDRIKTDFTELSADQGKNGDPVVRARVRQIIKNDFGLFNYIVLVTDHKAQLDPTETTSAFDSELSLLWWPDTYSRHRWIDNPLYYRTRSSPHHPKTPPVLMVMRLDGPTDLIVREMIATSIKVERQGLTGQVVLDARGKPVSDPYGIYDQTLRNLANLLNAHTTLKVTLDDAEPLLPPHSQKDVALYCGWYSLRHFVPCCDFNPGAVGFHVASFELVTLHNPAETGWVRGLLSSGVVATLGPVAEPYLQSFPRADEFFPLLLTGKLPLADVYWETTPWVSWMQTCIGDPLYNPYRVNMPLKDEDVPPVLHAVFDLPDYRPPPAEDDKVTR